MGLSPRSADLGEVSQNRELSASYPLAYMNRHIQVTDGGEPSRKRGIHTRSPSWTRGVHAGTELDGTATSPQSCSIPRSLLAR